VSIASKLKIENTGMFLTTLFYAIVGIIFFVLLPIAGFTPYLAMIGIFSLLTAYGVFRRRTWAIWFVIILFFGATTFSAVMIYNILQIDTLLGLSSIGYLILTWVFTLYAVLKRKAFET
jgi:SNF family Na+-dependent transporter